MFQRRIIESFALRPVLAPKRPSCQELTLSLPQISSPEVQLFLSQSSKATQHDHQKYVSCACGRQGYLKAGALCCATPSTPLTRTNFFIVKVDELLHELKPADLYHMVKSFLFLSVPSLSPIFTIAFLSILVSFKIRPIVHRDCFERHRRARIQLRLSKTYPSVWPVWTEKRTYFDVNLTPVVDFLVQKTSAVVPHELLGLKSARARPCTFETSNTRIRSLPTRRNHKDRILPVSTNIVCAGLETIELSSVYTWCEVGFGC